MTFYLFSFEQSHAISHAIIKSQEKHGYSGIFEVTFMRLLIHQLYTKDPGFKSPFVQGKFLQSNIFLQR